MLGTGVRLDDKIVGGAYVERPFRVLNELKPRGTTLTRAEVLSLRPQNRDALINGNFMREFPSAPNAEDGQLFVTRGSDLKYYVVRGFVVNDRPLTRDEAERMARGEVTA